MADNYTRIVLDNLDRLYDNLPEDLSDNLPGVKEEEQFTFKAFGETCLITPKGITLGSETAPSIIGILISLYALNAGPARCVPLPFKAFKEIPNSMPYVGAFTTHTEKLLVPHVDRIEAAIPVITEVLGGEANPSGSGGDFSLVVYPLPKIALCYIFYEADEDFPPSVTCLYSSNANAFLPVDGLADVGEYTSKKILTLI